jgi:hypothetical protein
MRPEAEKKLNKIKRFSSVLRRICQGFMGLMGILFVVAVVASLVGRGGTITAFDVTIPMRGLPLHQRLGLAGAIALAIGVLVKSLYHLQRLFASYANGEIFSRATARQIRQLGYSALLWAAANIVWLSVAAVLLHTRAPHAYTFQSDMLAIGAVVVVVSWFMDIAAELQEENDLTI